jgi:hypothetical protein
MARPVPVADPLAGAPATGEFVWPWWSDGLPVASRRLASVIDASSQLARHHRPNGSVRVERNPWLWKTTRPTTPHHASWPTDNALSVHAHSPAQACRELSQHRSGCDRDQRDGRGPHARWRAEAMRELDGRPNSRPWMQTQTLKPALQCPQPSPFVPAIHTAMSRTRSSGSWCAWTVAERSSSTCSLPPASSTAWSARHQEPPP